MTVFLQIPQDLEQRLRVVLRSIGYWGQSSSLASCLGVTKSSPVPGECALPLAELDGTFPLRPYFSCLATEFRSDQISWYDMLSDDEDTQKLEALRLEVYVWPMLTVYHHGTQKLLLRSPLPSSMPLQYKEQTHAKQFSGAPESECRKECIFAYYCRVCVDNLHWPEKRVLDARCSGNP